MPENLEVKAEIKREIALYNLARQNVMQGMRFLIQSKVPIARPDDFFAEMLKSDSHMKNIKSRLLAQQRKIKTFEEKKTRQENKKFHKALRDHKMRAKHAEKAENLKNIEKLKKRVQQAGGDPLADDEFDKIVNGQALSAKKGKKKIGALQQVRDKRKKAQMFKDKAMGRKTQGKASHLKTKQKVAKKPSKRQKGRGVSMK